MSKAVLYSIQPKWCKLIAEGKKTIEFRKTKPKLETPFKCYIYETKTPLRWNKAHNNIMGGEGGRVIAEFMCYDISEYNAEFYPPEKQPVYEAITEWNAENEVYEAVASNCDTYRTNFLKNACMTLEDFRDYLGVGDIPFYGLHISDLVIYDEPKELSEFTKPYGTIIKAFDSRYIQKPPQSWCYVEELSGA